MQGYKVGSAVALVVTAAMTGCTKFATPVADAALDNGVAGDGLDASIEEGSIDEPEGDDGEGGADATISDALVDSASCSSASPNDCPFSLTNGQRCVGNTLYTCATNAAGCVSLATQECPTTGACEGAYPVATCASEQDVGYPVDTGAGGNLIGGNLNAFAVQIGVPVTLQRFGIIMRYNGAGASVTMALYSSDPATGGPATLIAQTSSFTSANGTNEISASPMSTRLTAGTYWIAAAFNQANTAVGTAAPLDTMDFASYTYGDPLPATWPTTFNTLPNTSVANFYLVVLP
jgi:hypothetical protein